MQNRIDVEDDLDTATGWEEALRNAPGTVELARMYLEPGYERGSVDPIRKWHLIHLAETHARDAVILGFMETGSLVRLHDKIHADRLSEVRFYGDVGPR